MRFLAAILISLAFSATAQELSDDFQSIGEMNLMVDGIEMRLAVVIDLVNDRSFAEVRTLYGTEKMLNVAGVTPVDVGGFDFPMISFTITFNQAGRGNLMFIEMLEKGRQEFASTTAGAGLGRKELIGFSMDADGAFAFSFAGELLRTVYDDEYNQLPQEGQAPVIISGSVTVAVPEKYWLQ
ncbi:MAG: hypothetical protein ACC619_01385 [Paracoccaceae bacterium]